MTGGLRCNGMYKVLMLVWWAVLTMAVAAPAENYVNWKGGFWLTVPEGWEKVDYIIVDQLLAMTDTSREVYRYEAVFAPVESKLFIDDAYLVVTYDSTGPLTDRASDSILDNIARSYRTDTSPAPVAGQTADLVPGRPVIDRARKAVTVLSEIGLGPETGRMLRLYMRLNKTGLISLYCYGPDSTFSKYRPTFDGIIASLSFENLREAAGPQTVVMTDVSGDKAAASEGGQGAGRSSGIMGGKLKNTLLAAVVVVIAGALLWILVVAPRMRKNKGKPR